MTQFEAIENEQILPRMGVYIDLYNVEKAMEDYNINGMRLDYAELVAEVSEGYDLQFVKAYDSTESDDRALKDLHESLESMKIDMHLYKPQVFVEKNGTKRLVQKEVDTSIVADVISGAYEDEYDICMIISGDRDMCPCIEKVHRKGKKVKVAGFDIPMATCLKSNSDGCVIIEDTLAFVADPQEGVMLSNFASRPVIEGGVADVY